ncbi:FAD-dependent oxidoreductase [Nocardia sp. 2]|uniref:FAD-dependent oxidoreductase n=1 Tax=Nocardia acididurans TaxID=2802282 RepID=A0ABS1LZH7_9NOCA|nr:FAD-dependent oxidoreductase [Nocardia acididurans]MBL1073661.1 FAD-dependent oxidoreductase [Nocardia acididurans]
MSEGGVSRRRLLTAAVTAGAFASGALATTAGSSTRTGGDSVSQERSEALARELLGVGADGGDLTLTYLKTLVDTGLPAAREPRRIIVVGAGPAGLSAATLLAEAGHRVTVLEANGNRTGGRVKTFRGVFSDPALYAEAGAMRLSSAHPMALALADKLGVRRRPFYNSDVLPETVTPATPAVFYRSFTGEEWSNGPASRYVHPPAAGRSLITVNGKTVTRAEYAANPAAVHAGFGCALDESGGSTLDAVLRACAPGTDQPIERQVESWSKLLETYENHSLRGFLQEQGWTRRQLDAVGTLENLTSRLRHSIVFPLVDHSLIPRQATYWELEGGMATLTDALTRQLGSAILLGKRMTRLEQTDHSVRVWTTAESGDEHSDGHPVDPVESFDADYALLAIPLTAMRFCTFDPPLSYDKRRAVIEFHHDAATKVLLEFKTRFWEQGPTGFRGGSCLTDSPSRSIRFPSHVEGSDGGVVLASYTLADDALRWDSLTDSERIHFALTGMRDLFGPRVDTEFTGTGRSQSWLRNRYALGEAAFPTPGQLHEHHHATRTPEGRIHFAGDHTSLNTAWIEGALESGVRSALEIHHR